MYNDTLLTALSMDNLRMLNWHRKGNPFWILMKHKMMGGSGISWTICKSFAP